MEENCSHDLFPFFLSLLNLKLKRPPTSLTRGVKKPFSEVALQTRESLERPYFPMPLSILTNTYLIMFFFFFYATGFKFHEP